MTLKLPCAVVTLACVIECEVVKCRFLEYYRLRSVCTRLGQLKLGLLGDNIDNINVLLNTSANSYVGKWVS